MIYSRKKNSYPPKDGYLGIGLLFRLKTLCTKSSNPELVQYCNELFKKHDKVKNKFGFLAPNELFPKDSKPLLDNIPTKGIYIGVGTDRTLAHTYDASEIIQIDNTPIVVLFNIFNTELIKSCNNRKTYLELRKKILNHNNNYPNIDEVINDIITKTSLKSVFNQEKIKEFIKNFRETASLGDNKNIFSKIHTIDEENIHGYNTTYLHNNNEFDRIQNLARNCKIKSYLADLSTKEALKPIIDSLNNNTIVIDISNAWQRKYKMSNDGIKYIFEKHSETKILLTNSVTSEGSRVTYHIYDKKGFEEFLTSSMYSFKYYSSIEAI
jgi:hypothetical protein